MILKILTFALLAFAQGQNQIQINQAISLDNQSAEVENLGGAQVAQATKVGKSLGVKVNAESVVVMDSGSGKIIFNKNPNERLPMASTTKLMTSLLLLESGKSLDDVTVINHELIHTGTDIQLEVGEQIRVKDLLQAALITSANDAAEAIAQYVSAGDQNTFVELMNNRAAGLQLDDTAFVNPHGLDADGHYSSAADLAKLMQANLKFPVFREAISTREAMVYILNNNRGINLQNTNKLLGNNLPIIGAKTGFTDNAGRCLVTFAEKNGEGIIISVMNSSDTYQDTRALVEWTYQNYRWQ